MLLGQSGKTEYLNKQFPLLEIISDINQENRRILFQQGFFTKHDHYKSLEIWLNRITEELHNDQTESYVLEKFIFPCNEKQRGRMLDILDKMNINHRSLFPDVFGSVQDAIESTRRGFQSPKFKVQSYSSSKNK